MEGSGPKFFIHTHMCMYIYICMHASMLIWYLWEHKGICRVQGSRCLWRLNHAWFYPLHLDAMHATRIESHSIPGNLP